MIKKTFNIINALRVRLPRLIDARKELNMKNSYLKIKPLNHIERKGVLAFWKQWGGVTKSNLKYLSLYNENNENIELRNIPDDLYYGKIDTYFNKALDCAAIDDKNMYDLYFPDVIQPKTIARNINGDNQDEFYRFLSENDLVELCEKEGSVVIKKSVTSDGGHGVYFWNKTDGQGVLKQTLSELAQDFIVQEVLVQHPVLAKLHPDSINTIRIVTLNFKGAIHVLSAGIRMGIKGNKVDNGHCGGIFVGIDKTTGRLQKDAFSLLTRQRFLNEHPTTHAVFSECVIPSFDKCLDMVKILAPRLERVSRLTSWDVSVNENGEPVLVEVNLAYGNLFMHQYVNGPIFGDLTEDVLNEVLKAK